MAITKRSEKCELTLKDGQVLERLGVVEDLRSKLLAEAGYSSAVG